MQRDVSGEDAEETGCRGGDSTDAEVVAVGLAGAKVGAVEVVGPDGREGVDVAGESGDEAGENGGDAERQE